MGAVHKVHHHFRGGRLMTEGEGRLESGDVTTGTNDPPQFLTITPLLIQTEQESINNHSQEYQLGVIQQLCGPKFNLFLTNLDPLPPSSGQA